MSTRQADIANVIEKITSGWLASRWDELMPWNWTVRDVSASMAGMTDQIARIRITLADTDPLVWRCVEVPVAASLKMLHDVI